MLNEADLFSICLEYGRYNKGCAPVCVCVPKKNANEQVNESLYI